MRHSLKMLLVLTFTVLLTGTATGWKNEFNKPLEFSCPREEYISWVQSEYSEKSADRRWDFG